jgi:hypothetical protein
LSGVPQSRSFPETLSHRPAAKYTHSQPVSGHR